MLDTLAHSLCVCHLPIKLYCIVLYSFVLYLISTKINLPDRLTKQDRVAGFLAISQGHKPRPQATPTNVMHAGIISVSTGFKKGMK